MANLFPEDIRALMQMSQQAPREDFAGGVSGIAEAIGEILRQQRNLSPLEQSVTDDYMSAAGMRGPPQPEAQLMPPAERMPMQMEPSVGRSTPMTQPPQMPQQRAMPSPQQMGPRESYSLSQTRRTAPPGGQMSLRPRTQLDWERIAPIVDKRAGLRRGEMQSETQRYKIDAMQEIAQNKQQLQLLREKGIENDEAYKATKELYDGTQRKLGAVMTARDSFIKASGDMFSTKESIARFQQSVDSYDAQLKILEEQANEYQLRMNEYSTGARKNERTPDKTSILNKEAGTVTPIEGAPQTPTLPPPIESTTEPPLGIKAPPLPIKGELKEPSAGQLAELGVDPNAKMSAATRKKQQRGGPGASKKAAKTVSEEPPSAPTVSSSDQAYEAEKSRLKSKYANMSPKDIAALRDDLKNKRNEVDIVTADNPQAAAYIIAAWKAGDKNKERLYKRTIARYMSDPSWKAKVDQWLPGANKSR